MAAIVAVVPCGICKQIQSVEILLLTHKFKLRYFEDFQKLRKCLNTYCNVISNTVCTSCTMRHICCWIAYSKTGIRSDRIPCCPTNVTIVFFTSDTHHIVLILQMSGTMICSTSSYSVTCWVAKTEKSEKASIRIVTFLK